MYIVYLTISIHLNYITLMIDEQIFLKKNLKRLLYLIGLF